MFSLTKIFLFAAALISLVVATNNNLPAPIRSSRLSQPYRIGTSQDAGFASNSSISANALSICNHCYLGFGYLAPPGSKFLEFSGNIIVPNNDPDNSQATNFLWPGLENDGYSNNLFVLQPVIKGTPQDLGRWSTFENYLVGAYNDPPGNSVPISVKETLPFSMKINPDGNSWSISAAGAKNNFPITEDLVYALFAGEFYNSNWYFGDLVFTNVKLVASGRDSSFCVKGGYYSEGAVGKWEGLHASTDGNGNTVCNIKKLTMSSA